MPFKPPPPKKGQKRKIIIEFSGPMERPDLKRLATAVKALVRKHKKHKLKIIKKGR